MLTFRATWVGFFAKSYKQNSSRRFMTTSNKIVSCIANNGPTQDIYLDSAAEFSKVDRKNHKQVTDKGVPLVYDLMVTITSPLHKLAESTTNPGVQATGVVKTAPLNWQTRNAVRMAHFTREDLRKEAGVTKGSIGRYAKNLRCNLDDTMYGIQYKTNSVLGPGGQPTSQRLYAMKDIRTNSLVASLNSAGNRFAGGVWDYTQLSQVRKGVTGAPEADDFFLNICESHSAVAPGPYDYIGLLQAYNQRRQTTLDDSTLTSGGDTQFIDNDSPFFRVPEQDISEDAYVQVTLDEQDAPPYDRDIGVGISIADSKELQPAEFFQLTDVQAIASFRVQAPLGLVKFELSDLLGSVSGPEPYLASTQFLTFEIECMGTYEM